MERLLAVGRGRRSKMVMLGVGNEGDLWRRDARVRPEGPAPIMAILGVGIVMCDVWFDEIR